MDLEIETINWNQSQVRLGERWGTPPISKSQVESQQLSTPTVAKDLRGRNNSKQHLRGVNICLDWSWSPPAELHLIMLVSSRDGYRLFLP